MNYIKSFLGIISAFLIVFGLMAALAYTFDNYSVKDMTFDIIYHFIIVAALFFILVFLSTYFTLPPKKYGAVFTIIISYLFGIFIMYYHLVKLNQPLNYIMIASSTGLIVGLLSGIIVGHRLFLNKGWNKPKTIESDLNNY